ncbi:MAG: hypothetical protein GXO29_00715 [Thermotogae bacterium]|nr:hypothetical protein [Thermotogota bacterium]
MLLSLLKGRRGLLIPFSVSFALLIFSSLIGVEWEVSLSVASFVGGLTIAENVARALWEDDAVSRLTLRYGFTGVLLLLSAVISIASLILNVALAFMVAIVASAPILAYSLGLLLWVISSSLLCTITSAMGEVAGVSMGFIAAVLQVPLLIGLYGYLSGGNAPTYLGLLVVMGVFYLAFMGVFSDVILEG